ncbi:hypothetical protein B0H10DRAFT_2243989 [Mycena sp. CBHHK59/15]|nr:hypothetical protein B0H10DRAFT_2243989 [Mycena sp. CBHHK59/15]
MAAAFGADRTSPEAKGWAAYWCVLGAAEEAGTESPPFPLIDRSSPDVEMADGAVDSGSLPALSNVVLTAAKEDRARERADRKANGNQHSKGKMKSGRAPSDLMASAFIEREVMNSKKEMKAMYYCIGCNHEVHNNTEGRNTSHMIGCKLSFSFPKECDFTIGQALQRDFPAMLKVFKDPIGPSAEQVASGDVLAPALCTKKKETRKSR